MTVGVLLAAQLMFPDLTNGISWLSYGRLRPLHTNAVISLSGGTHDALRAAYGKELFAANCVACHGPAGNGKPGPGCRKSDRQDLALRRQQYRAGRIHRQGPQRRDAGMGEFLGDEKIHVMAAYVWGLSNVK